MRGQDDNDGLLLSVKGNAAQCRRYIGLPQVVSCFGDGGGKVDSAVRPPPRIDYGNAPSPKARVEISVERTTAAVTPHSTMAAPHLRGKCCDLGLLVT